jgi:DNA polymerase-3 subunit alpha
VRAEGGAFKGMVDFACRVDGRKVNRRVVESLVKCGAFDSLHPRRAAVWAGLDTALEAGAALQRDREIGQESLFGGTGGAPATEPQLVDAPPWTDRQRLEYEKEVLGFYVTGHPLAAVAPLLQRFANVSAGETEGKDGREVRAGGIITALRETRTRRGALMAFATLEDLEGTFDLVVFAEPYAQHGSLLKAAAASEGERGPLPLLVGGDLEAGDPPKILVRDVLELERAEEKLSTQLIVRIRAEEATEDRLTALLQLLENHPGECAVTLHLVIPDESETRVAISAVRGVRPVAALRRDVDDLFGRAVTELAV